MSVKDRVIRLVAFATICGVIIASITIPEFVFYFSMFLMMNMIAFIIYSLLF